MRSSGVRGKFCDGVIYKDMHGVQGDQPRMPSVERVTAGGNCHPHWLDGKEEKAVAGIQRDGGWSCRRDCGLSRMHSANSRVHRSGRRERARNRSTSLFPASALLPGQSLAKPYRKPEGVWLNKSQALEHRNKAGWKRVDSRAWGDRE